MKRIIALSAIILIYSCGGNTKFVEYYDDTKTQKAYEGYQNSSGELDGICTEYRENGNVLRKISWTNGKLNGDYFQYYNNGEFEFHIVYRNNCLWNVIEYYDMMGNKLDYGNFKDGEGSIQAYSPEGVLRKSGDYKAGLKNGEWKYYSNAGYSHSVDYNNGTANNQLEPDYLPPF